MTTGINYTRRVRYSDTDAQGHVFNANYFVYFDDAVTDYMLAAVGPGNGGEGWDILLVHSECDYKSSAQLHETVVVNASVEKIGNTSLAFVLAATDEATGREIVRGKEIWVTVDSSTMRPVPVPESLKKGVAKLQGG